MKTQIPLCNTVFGFSSKTSFFAGLDLSGTFLFYSDVGVGVGVGGGKKKKGKNKEKEKQ